MGVGLEEDAVRAEAGVEELEQGVARMFGGHGVVEVKHVVVHLLPKVSKQQSQYYHHAHR